MRRSAGVSSWTRVTSRPSAPSPWRTGFQPSEGVARDEVDGAVLGVGLLPELDHPLAEGTVAQPGLGDDAPAERLRDPVGGHLALSQGAVGEVPQRALPGDRFVDDDHVADGT
jgi:hypothetical protein